MSIELDTVRVLVLGIAVLWAGEQITRKVGALRRFSIPIAVGIAMATATGQRRGYGLIGAGISLAGGHGTAITWGVLGEEAGLEGATAPRLAAAAS